MNLRTAHHIVSLAQHLNFTRAAAELGLTQSALSRSIQQFERECGLTLFDRNRARVRVSAIGEPIIRQAKLLLNQARELDRLIDCAAGGRQHSVAFGMGRTAAVALLPQLLAHGLQASPDLHYQAFVRASNTLLTLLLTEEIEFFVAAEQSVPKGANVEGFAITEFPMAQLVRAGHPLLAGKSPLRYGDYPWMIASGLMQQGQAANSLWSHLRDEPQIILEDLACAARLTEKSDVIWVTSRFSAVRELSEGRLSELPFPAGAQKLPYHPYKLMIYKSRGKPLSPSAQELAESILKMHNASVAIT